MCYSKAIISYINVTNPPYSRREATEKKTALEKKPVLLFLFSHRTQNKEVKIKMVFSYQMNANKIKTEVAISVEQNLNSKHSIGQRYMM